MRKLLNYLLLVAATAVICSCGRESIPDQPETPQQGQADDQALSVSATEVTLPADGGQETVTITTSATQWEAKSSQSWCTASTEGNTLTISAGENNSTEQRVATVTVSAKGVTGVKTINVTQIAKGQKMLELSSTSASFHQSGVNPSSGIPTITLTTDVAFSELRLENDADWCFANLNDGHPMTITYGVQQNLTSQPRTATISVVVVATGQKVSFTVTQAPDDGTGYLIVGSFLTNDTVYSSSRSGYAGYVTTNRGNWTVDSDVEWLHPQRLGDGFAYEVDEYEDTYYKQPRKGIITFYDGSTPIGTYTVLQNVDADISIVCNLRGEAGTVFAQYMYFDVSPSGGTYDLQVKTRSCKWEFRYETPETYKQLASVGHTIDNSWFTVEILNHAMLRLHVTPRSAGNTTTRYGAFTVLPRFSSYYLSGGMIRDYMLPTIVVTDSADPSLGGENYGYGEHSDFD